MTSGTRTPRPTRTCVLPPRPRSLSRPPARREGRTASLPSSAPPESRAVPCGRLSPPPRRRTGFLPLRAFASSDLRTRAGVCISRFGRRRLGGGIRPRRGSSPRAGRVTKRRTPQEARAHLTECGGFEPGRSFFRRRRGRGEACWNAGIRARVGDRRSPSRCRPKSRLIRAHAGLPRLPPPRPRSAAPITHRARPLLPAHALARSPVRRSSPARPSSRSIVAMGAVTISRTRRTTPRRRTRRKRAQCAPGSLPPTLASGTARAREGRRVRAGRGARRGIRIGREAAPVESIVRVVVQGSIATTRARAPLTRNAPTRA